MDRLVERPVMLTFAIGGILFAVLLLVTQLELMS